MRTRKEPRPRYGSPSLHARPVRGLWVAIHATKGPGAQKGVACTRWAWPAPHDMTSRSGSLIVESDDAPTIIPTCNGGATIKWHALYIRTLLYPSTPMPIIGGRAIEEA